MREPPPIMQWRPMRVNWWITVPPPTIAHSSIET
jgi:hypothetical protein